MTLTSRPFRLAAAIAGAVLGVIVLALPATAGAETDLTVMANRERSARGIATYPTRSDLVAVARRHAARMAAEGRIWHNPNLQHEVSGWQAVGENVGTGPSARAVHDAFMASPTHRDNILDRVFTEIGVGTAVGADGMLYVAQVFRRPATVAASEPVARPAAPRVAPQPRPATVTPSRRAVTPPGPAKAPRPARLRNAAVAQAFADRVDAGRGTFPHMLAVVDLIAVVAD